VTPEFTIAKTGSIGDGCAYESSCFPPLTTRVSHTFTFPSPSDYRGGECPYKWSAEASLYFFVENKERVPFFSIKFDCIPLECFGGGYSCLVDFNGGPWKICDAKLNFDKAYVSTIVNKFNSMLGGRVILEDLTGGKGFLDKISGNESLLDIEVNVDTINRTIIMTCYGTHTYVKACFYCAFGGSSFVCPLGDGAAGYAVSNQAIDSWELSSGNLGLQQCSCTDIDFNDDGFIEYSEFNCGNSICGGNGLKCGWTIVG
jgi:hypothetical protein